MARPKERFDDFYVRIHRTVPAGTKLQSTIHLLVDRLDGNDDSGAMLVIDSIDFGVTSAKKKN